MDEEKWKPVPIGKYSPYYLVSNLGNVYSMKRKITLKQTPRNGYPSICLSHKDEKKTYQVHRLVALCFVENPDLKEIVNHKDGNRTNNKAENLEWVTFSGNSNHAVKVLNIKHSSRKVLQLNENGSILDKYDSIIEAARITGANDRHISDVCKGKRNFTGGYRWKYIEDDPNEEIPQGLKYPGYPNYIITREGKIFSIRSNRYLKLNKQQSGYINIGLSNGTKKDFYVHILVATLYIPTEEGKDFVNHKNRQKHDNRVENLEWVTSSENMLHAVMTKLQSITI